MSARDGRGVAPTDEITPRRMLNDYVRTRAACRYCLWIRHSRYWGEDGYFRIARGVDECYIEDQITATGPGATWALKSELATLL